MSNKRLVRNIAASLGQVVVSAITLLVMYRLMMRQLSMTEIGLWSLVIGSTTVARLSELGLGAGVLRFVARDIANDDREQAASTIFMAAGSIAILVSVIMFLIRPFILQYLLHVTPVNLHQTVKILLNSAIIVVMLSSIGNVFMNAVDGCQRVDIRCVWQTLGNIAQLAVTFYILPRYGVNGLGMAQVAQACILLVGGVITSQFLIRAPLRAYFRVDIRRLKEMLAYGGAMQITGIAGILWEPQIKFLLTAYSGIPAAGYFDMANKILVQFRSLLLAGYSALVPYVAALSGGNDRNREKIRDTYCQSVEIMNFIEVPYFSVIVAALPGALTLWKGAYDTEFLTMALALSVGWFLNCLNIPAYFINVATGNLRWNVVSHVWIGLVLLVLGPVLGAAFGYIGVLAATVIAHASGSLVVVVMFHRKYDVPFRNILPYRSVPGFVVFSAAVAYGVALVTGASEFHLYTFVTMPIVLAVFASLAGWFDPTRAALQKRLFYALKPA